MRYLYDWLKAKLMYLWANPLVSRAAHTFWQAFLAVFLIGASPIITMLLNQNYSDAKTALLALAVAALAAGLSALKTYIAQLYESWKATQA